MLSKRTSRTSTLKTSASLALNILLLAVAAPAVAVAQGVTVTGGVSLVSAGDTVPLPNVMVTLHRVDLVGGAPLDSVRTDRRGSYRFAGIPFDTTALFVASANHAGIAYFTAPVPMRGDSAGLAAPLVVYATSSVAPRIELIQRHIIVTPTEDGASLGVLELIILGNNGSVTRVSPDSIVPVWTLTIPAQAAQFSVGEGEVSDDAIERRGNTVAVTAPVPPGRRQLVFTYLLPRSLARVDFPVDQPTSQMIVLVDSRAQATLTGGLDDLGPRAIGQQTYSQYQGSNLPAGTQLALAVAGPPADPTNFVPWLIGLVALVMGATLVWRLRAAPQQAPVAAVIAPHPEGIAARIAALDSEYESLANPTAEQTESYSRQRAELKQVLQRALAKAGEQA